MTFWRTIQYRYRRHFLRRWIEWRFARRYDVYRGGGASRITRIPDDALPLSVDLHLVKKAGKIARRLLDAGISDERSAFPIAVLEHLNPFERAVHLLRLVDLEVRNGGFTQYYFNTEGRYEAATKEAYALVGAEEYGSVFERAAERATYCAEAHNEVRSNNDPAELLRSFSVTYNDNPLNDIDSAYYGCEPKIEIVLASFIRRHANEFPRETL